MKFLIPLSLLFTCACTSPVAPAAAPTAPLTSPAAMAPCPDAPDAWTSPVIHPMAQNDTLPLGSAAMLDPHQVTRYHVDAPLADVIAFYDRCVDQPRAQDNGEFLYDHATHHRSIPEGEHTLRIKAESPDKTQLIVTCYRCY